MNLKRVSIRNEIFIRFNPQLNLPCKHKLSLKCRSGLKLNPDSCKLPLTCFWTFYCILHTTIAQTNKTRREHYTDCQVILFVESTVVLRKPLRKLVESSENILLTKQVKFK